MSGDFYQSPMLSRAYDPISLNTPTIRGDISFYRNLVQKSGRSVLDLACGTGRVAIDLAKDGTSVVGVDLSSSLLDMARRKAARLQPEARSRLTFVEQDMSTIDLGRRFDLVIVSFRSFQHLLTGERQRACLQAIRRHLVPGGRLALHLFDPQHEALVDGVDHKERRSGIDPASGRQFVCDLMDLKLDRVNQIRKDVWRFREIDLDGNVVDETDEEVSLRWTHRWELRYLFELCGFIVEAEYSDFDGTGPTYGGEMILVATAE